MKKIKELRLNEDMTSVPLGDVLNAYSDFNAIIDDQKKEIKKLKNQLYYYKNRESRQKYIKKWKSENKDKQREYEKKYMQTDKYKENHNKRNNEYRKGLKVKHISEWINEFNNSNCDLHINELDCEDVNILKIMLFDTKTLQKYTVRNIYLNKRFTKKDFQDFIKDMVGEL